MVPAIRQFTGEGCTMTENYDPTRNADRWTTLWDEREVFAASTLTGPTPADRPRTYVVKMLPYPSGDLHMGHAEAYSIGDAIARFARMRGHDVLNPIGWDSFGLPAENAAIRRGLDPREWTYANIETQAQAFRRLGISFDWRTRLHTSDPDFYRWNQWLFLRMYERGLAYRAAAPVNWCSKDRTVLANEQVINGRCERCGTPVVRRELTQWFLRITAYADRLLTDMTRLEAGWPADVLTMQRNWIGRSADRDGVVPAARLADLPPTILGHSDPDRALLLVRPGPCAGRRTAGAAAARAAHGRGRR
jgi:leucyl-tRNA synthetase